MYVQHFHHHMDQPGYVANPARSQLNRENSYFSCPRSCLRIWSREKGSAVTSRVSLLFLHTQDESDTCSREIPAAFHVGVHIYCQPPSDHSDFIGSRNCVSMVFTAESPLAQGQ
ncbi:unnamed protein product [Ascophyllum nodosum]